jgi:thiol:disulfide interchange protein DsbD
MNRFLLPALLPVLLAASALAQFGDGGRGLKFNDVVTKVEATVEPATAKPGDTVTWKLTLELIPGWHTYPTRQPDPKADSQVNRIKLPTTGDVVAAGPVKEPPNPVKTAEPALEIKELHYYEGKVVWEAKLKIAATATPGVKTIKVPVTILACKESCLPPKTIPTEAKLTVEAGAPAAAAPGAPATAAAPPEVKAAPAADDDTVAASADHQEALAAVLAQITRQQVQPNTGLASFLLTAVFWGAVSLFTPCVFPMIPITVSFFLKQSEKNHTNPVLLALVYCGTIVIVLGVAALTLLGFFRQLSINPWMNFFLGTLFVVLALSLFGMFELTLPSFLTRFTSSREGQGGLVGTVFMALTFTIVSFTCVAPFLGGFGGMASSGQFRTWELVLGAMAFSGTFASPFFLLALFPSLLKKLPKSGGWLNSVKVVMGFLELAAALKFFRAGELIHRQQPLLFTYDLVLGMWIALSILCGLYLLNLFRLGHDEPLESVSVPRFLTGFLFISLGLYLLPALFVAGSEGERQRPRGTIYAWVDSFLLPEPRDASAEGLPWTGDLARALNETRAEAARSGKDQLVFVDFTGETCTNCKLNEKEVFTKKEIKELFRPYKLVQLYTDKVPDQYYSTAQRSRFTDTSKQIADAKANLWFQGQAFGTEQLPLYVILRPVPGSQSVEVVGVYDEGKINNVGAFAEFLKKPFAADTARAAR